MRPNFTVTSLPELKALPMGQRLRVLFRLRKKLIRIKSAGFALMAITSLGVLGIVISMVYEDIDQSELLSAIVLKIVYVTALVLVMWPVITWFDRRQVRAALWETYPTGRVDYCVKCDYDLRGSTGVTCPECGTEIHLMPAKALTTETPDAPIKEHLK